MNVSAVYSPRANLRALRRCFQLHDDNNDSEKKLLWVTLTVWGIIAVGTAFGFADATPTFDQLTTIVVAMLFQQLGYERGILSSEDRENGNGGEN